METEILNMANGIVKTKLGSKVPPSITCVLVPDVFCMKGKECLVERHARRTAVKVHPHVVNWPPCGVGLTKGRGRGDGTVDGKNMGFGVGVLSATLL